MEKGKKQTDNSFILEDFKEISAKLDDTDRKTHNCIQTFCALVGVIAGIMVSKLIEMKWEEILEKSNILLGVTFMICCIGEFNFCYLLTSQRVQNEYLRRINRLRTILLVDSGRQEDFLQPYGYLTAKPPQVVGMGSLMIYFVGLVVLIFTGGSYYLAHISHRPNIAVAYFFLLIMLSLINSLMLLFSHRSMRKRCRTENLMIKSYLADNGIKLSLNELSQNDRKE